MVTATLTRPMPAGPALAPWRTQTALDGPSCMSASTPIFDAVVADLGPQPSFDSSDFEFRWHERTHHVAKHRRPEPARRDLDWTLHLDPAAEARWRQLLADVKPGPPPEPAPEPAPVTRYWTEDYREVPPPAGHVNHVTRPYYARPEVPPPVEVASITVHRSEPIPGGQGARLGYSDDHPDRQFLVIPDGPPQLYGRDWWAGGLENVTPPAEGFHGVPAPEPAPPRRPPFVNPDWRQP